MMLRNPHALACLGLLCGALAAQNTAGKPTGTFQLESPSGPAAMGPNLSVGPKGVILSWLEPAAEAEPAVQQGRRRGRGRGRPRRAYALRWATLEDSGWSAAKTITEGENFFANWADFPTVVAGSNDSVLASWLANNGRGTFGYGIQLALSADGGDSWKPLGSPHSTEVASEYGFVSILAEETGFRVYWLDGRELGMSGGGNGQMSLRTALVQGGLGAELVLDADVCTCCQTSATITASGPALVYRDHEEGEIRDISIVRQTEQGWSDPQNVYGDGWRIGGCPVNGPAIASMGDTTAVAWFTQAEDRPMVRVAFSRDGGAEFGDAITLDTAQPVGRVAVVGVTGGAVVGWLAKDGQQAVFRLRHVTADGVVGPAMDLGHTNLSRDSGFPRMVTRGDDIVLAWRETGEPAQLRTALLPLSALANSER